MLKDVYKTLPYYTQPFCTNDLKSKSTPEQIDDNIISLKNVCDNICVFVLDLATRTDILNDEGTKVNKAL